LIYGILIFNRKSGNESLACLIMPKDKVGLVISTANNSIRAPLKV
jgi:hypothetical protein